MAKNLNTFEGKALEGLINLNLSRATFLHSKLKINGASVKSVAFLISVLEIYFEKKIPDRELFDFITEGHGDKNFDAIVIKGKTVYIFDISEENPKDDELFKFSNSVEEFVCKRPSISSLKNANSRIKDKLEELHKLKKPKIKIIIARKSVLKEENCKAGFERLKKATQSASGISFKYLNSHQLNRFLYEPENFLSQFTFDVSEDNFLGPKKKSAEYFLKISLDQLLKLKHECDFQNKNLFSKNIRSFIDENKVSKQMLSVISLEPQNFHLYHNGITMISTKTIRHNPGPKFEVYEPQIVNGCQTISSIYKKYSQNLNAPELKLAYILVKTIEADTELAHKICQTSNTQTAIKPWDLRSNDDIQKQIEYYINNVSSNKFYYKRKFDKKPTHGREVISLPELTQWIYSAKFEDPAKAKNEKASLFENSNENSLYRRVEESVNPELIDNVSKIGVAVRGFIKKSPKEKKGILRDANFQLIAALYKLKDYDGKKLKYIENVILTLVTKIRKQNPDISNNRLFTKTFEFKRLGKKKEMVTMWKLICENL